MEKGLMKSTPARLAKSGVARGKDFERSFLEGARAVVCAGGTKTRRANIIAPREGSALSFSFQLPSFGLKAKIPEGVTGGGGSASPWSKDYAPKALLVGSASGRFPQVGGNKLQCFYI